MDLKIETKTIQSVDIYELDKFIKTYLPQYLDGKDKMLEEIRDYEVVAYEEWNNDESHELEVRATSEEFEKYTDSLMYNLGAILDLLCSKGHIEEGSYVIKVFW